MHKFLIATLVVVPSLAAAATPEPHRFTRDGQTYIYTTTTNGSRQVIDGYSANTGNRFHLIVRDGVVTGQSGGQPVAFHVAAADRAIETAAR